MITGKAAELRRFNRGHFRWKCPLIFGSFPEIYL